MPTEGDLVLLTEFGSGLFYLKTDLESLVFDCLLDDAIAPSWLDIVNDLLEKHPRLALFFEQDVKNFFHNDVAFRTFKNFWILWYHKQSNFL